jgi:hypothetical protein
MNPAHLRKQFPPEKPPALALPAPPFGQIRIPPSKIRIQTKGSACSENWRSPC